MALETESVGLSRQTGVLGVEWKWEDRKCTLDEARRNMKLWKVCVGAE